MAVKTNITINIVEPGSDVPVPDTGLFTHGIGGVEASIIATVTIIALLVVAVFFIVRKKKRLYITKPSKHTSIILGLLAIITSIGTFTGLALNSIYNNTNAKEGDLTVATEDADLTIELGDEPVFAVLPVDVKVQESTPAGYTLTSYAENTDLVSITDSSNIIPMITTDEGELVALKDNTYGLSTAKPESKDDKTYTLLSTAADNPTFITDKDYKATEANDTTTIYYGFYITPDTPYGTYKSSDIYYNATTNSSKVIFHGNGLYFNNSPEQTTNDVEYITGITSNTAKYSHTPNVNDEGEASGIVGYHSGSDILNKVITIPGASKISIKLSYGGGYISGGYPAGFVSFWQGSHPDYTTGNNIGDAIKTCGTSDVTDGKFYGNRSNENAIITTECELEGNAVTFAYWAQGGGPSQGAIYGYYATVTGYDADGNIIYLPGNTQVGGEYKDPAQDLPYIFLGWNEDKEATVATYESKNDIELNLPLAKGKTTELYAIWQHATKIHLDGNGSTSGEIPDKLLAAGKGTSLCGYYSRDGYIFNNWNTKPDGSGESYGQCYWYTAPADQSVELNLYAQWSPATTITYDGNGGEGNQQQQAIRAGETQNIWGNWGYFNKDGYAFSHWNTKPDGTGTSYYEGQEFTASDQSTTITLYAQWSPATTIVYDGNGGEGNKGNQTIRAGDTQNIWGNWSDFFKEGYAWANWNTEPDGSGETYYEGDQFTAPDQSTTITLYAQWSPATTIIYDGNGGSGNGPTQTIRAGETSNIYDNQGYFNKNGYIFSHWNTKPDGSGETYHAGDQFTAPDQSTTITLYAQWINGTILDTGATVGAKLKRLAGNSSAGWYTEDTNVTTIARASTLPADFVPTNDNTISIDGSVTPVYAWYDADTTTIYYYAESDEIIMNPDSSNMFYTFRNLSDATSIADWDTTYVTNMTIMFYSAGSNATTFSLDLSSWDTSNVTDMGQMLQSAGENATTWSIGDLSSWDTSKVTNMSNMFGGAGRNATTWSIGDLSSWDTSKVTSMASMFYDAGRNATTWSIGDISSWDTSKVTSMASMFNGAGYNATTWSIGDLSSWDTSNATDMSYMFRETGSNATTWSIGDISSWDTSKVTNMYSMFAYAGRNATTWSIGDLSSWDTSKVTDMSFMFLSAGSNATTWSIGDLSSWDTSKVTDMRWMFHSAGPNATTWSIGDLSSWNTSNVTDMSLMFYYAGSNATTWSIGDLSSWDTSKVTDMRWMFAHAGSNATTWSVGDLSSWDTSNVTDMNWMFYYTGYNATTFSLDLSSWDTSKVTDMSGMFYQAGYNATTWSVIIPQKTGDINNTTSAFYGQNSSIYADPPYNRFFTLATQANSNTTNTTESLNSVNNVETPIQGGSSGNRSVYATDDTEDTDNIDNTGLDTTSTPSRQEPLGEYQSSNTTEGTNIIIPILIAISITLGTSALGLLIYKSRRREDE